MKVRSRLKWAALGLVLAFASVMILQPSWGQKSSPDTNAQVQSENQMKLQEEKMRQEIKKLELENQKLKSFWAQLPSYGAIFTALIALIGIFVTIWKQINERKFDRMQRENEKFTSIVGDLGSESEATQAGAAVSILTFTRPKYKAFHYQVFLILLANLKIKHTDTVKRLLIKSFEKAIRTQLPSVKEKREPFEVDLSRSFLERVDLSDLKLKNADIGYAKLRGADLTGADLFRIRGWKANLQKAKLSRANLKEARFKKAKFTGAQFHDANLVSARLENTDLREAQFQKAEMQSAHLNDADLTGARFEKAKLNDAYFNGATIDAGTKKSIINAYDWQKAHFDEKMKDELEKMVATRG
jgi:uncharacterized protein YjbI with pentapeptide repeats/cell division protein FtsB